MNLLTTVIMVMFFILGVVVGALMNDWHRRPLTDLEKRLAQYEDEHAQGFDDDQRT